MGVALGFSDSQRKQLSPAVCTRANCTNARSAAEFCLLCEASGLVKTLASQELPRIELVGALLRRNTTTGALLAPIAPNIVHEVGQGWPIARGDLGRGQLGCPTCPHVGAMSRAAPRADTRLGARRASR